MSAQLVSLAERRKASEKALRSVNERNFCYAALSAATDYLMAGDLSKLENWLRIALDSSKRMRGER